MKVFLRCTCGTRTKRAVKGCEHKWASQFKYNGSPRPIPIQTPHKDKREAELYADRFKLNWIRKSEGRPVDEEFRFLLTDSDGKVRGKSRRGQLLGDVRDKFLQMIEDRGNMQTLRLYRLTCDRFVAFLGADRLVHTLCVDDVNRWRTHRITVNSPRFKTQPRPATRWSVNGELTGVQALCTFAGIGHLIFGKTVVVNGVKRPGITRWKEQKRERKHKPIAAEDVALAYARLPDPYDVICRTTHATLARLSEVCHLKYTDIGTSFDERGKMIGWMIRMQKGGGSERLPIPPDLVLELQARPTSKAQPFLFPGMQTDSVSAKMRTRLDKLGLSFSHHAFKHTGITQALDRGSDTDLLALQEQAGWTSLKMLPTYGHPSDAGGRRLVDGNAALISKALGSMKRDPIQPLKPGRKPTTKVSA